LLLANAKIEGGPEEPASEAVAIEGGRIAAVGPAAELRRLGGGEVVEIDAGGRRVIPGLIDSHAHVLRAGLTWDREVRWEGVASLDAALASVRTRAQALGTGAWVPVIGGWHEGQFAEGRRPTRDDLDRIAPDNPVYVQRLYTEAVLNSAGLK